MPVLRTPRVRVERAHLFHDFAAHHEAAQEHDVPPQELPEERPALEPANAGFDFARWQVPERITAEGLDEAHKSGLGRSHRRVAEDERNVLVVVEVSNQKWNRAGKPLIVRVQKSDILAATRRESIVSGRGKALVVLTRDSGPANPARTTSASLVG